MSNTRNRPPFGGRTPFADRLTFGSEAERLVALWAERQGDTVIPLHALPPSPSGGPRIRTPQGLLTAPDLAIFGGSRIRLAEVKRRRAPTLHRKTATLCSGIEIRDLDGYLSFAAATDCAVLLMFIHDEGAPELLGGDVEVLAGRIHHEGAGMVFWRLRDLPVLADAQEMAEIQAEFDTAGQGPF